MAELFLETEPEWRLYEELRARNVAFQLRAQPPKLQSEDDLQGRTQFGVGEEWSVVWMGAAGFVLRDRSGREVTAAGVPAVMAALEA